MNSANLWPQKCACSSMKSVNSGRNDVIFNCEPCHCVSVSPLLTNSPVKLALCCAYEANTKLVACLIQIGERFRFCFVSVTKRILTYPFNSPRKPPSTGPLAPQPPGEMPPDPPPVPPESRPGAWRSVHQRGGFRRPRRKSGAPPAGPVIETTPPVAPPPDRAGSWATWQGKYI